MKKILSFAAALFTAVVVFAGASPAVHAQSNGLGITPRKDLTIQPGSSSTDQLYISNLNNSQTLNLNLQVIDFSAKDQTGTPELNLDANAPETPWSLRPFITAPKTVTVAPGKVEYVKFSVAIPKGQGAGSYYSAIRYSTSGPGGQNNVAVSASGATLVFVTVPGSTKESLSLNKFGAWVTDKNNEDQGVYKSIFTKSQPLELAYTLKNGGNIAERPNGSIIIRNMFGKESKIIKDANPKSSLALRDQTRRFQVCIVGQQEKDSSGNISSNSDIKCLSPKLAPGRYTATLNVLYGVAGNNTQEIETTASFWVIPGWLIILVIVLILLIALGIWLLVRKIRGGASTFKRKR